MCTRILARENVYYYYIIVFYSRTPLVFSILGRARARHAARLGGAGGAPRRQLPARLRPIVGRRRPVVGRLARPQGPRGRATRVRAAPSLKRTKFKTNCKAVSYL